MRAVRFHRFGRPEEVLQLDDLPAPEPSPGQVRVRLTHRPINPADLLVVRGRYGTLPDLPAAGGAEGVGVVEALGEGVEGLAVGQRVVPLAAGPTWQEGLLARPDDLLPVPDGVPDESAAQLFVNPLTAWLLLAAVPGLRKGDTIMQTAGASAVGRLVTALAQRRGLGVVSVVRSEASAERVRAQGTDAIVLDGTGEGAREALRRTAGAAGAQAAFDGVAGPAGGLLFDALADGGVFVNYGRLSGQPLPVPPEALIYKQATVRGVWRTRWFAETPRAEARKALDELAALAAEGALPLPVEATYDLAAAKAAAAHAIRPGREGKILLVG
ncbi:MAG TPA: zinc-dependent alcohol dehydrogenase family protein [Rubricoccaceae bacterium]|nr:zinc-dependent alcohol dehydrogenase family protein [Rubricoccaceae bacterium]